MTGIDTIKMERLIEGLRTRGVLMQICADAADTIAALREKLEAAEAALRRTEANRDALRLDVDDLQAELTEARAGQAAAFMAGRDAAAEATITARTMHDAVSDIVDITPPADLSTVLQAVKDAEWDAALEKAACIADLTSRLAADRIRALRRAAPTEDR